MSVSLCFGGRSAAVPVCLVVTYSVHLYTPRTFLPGFVYALNGPVIHISPTIALVEQLTAQIHSGPVKLHLFMHSNFATVQHKTETVLRYVEWLAKL